MHSHTIFGVALLTASLANGLTSRFQRQEIQARGLHSDFLRDLDSEPTPVIEARDNEVARGAQKSAASPAAQKPGPARAAQKPGPAPAAQKPGPARAAQKPGASPAAQKPGPAPAAQKPGPARGAQRTAIVRRSAMAQRSAFAENLDPRPTPVIEARARNTNAPKPGLRAGKANAARAGVRARNANAALADAANSANGAIVNAAIAANAANAASGAARGGKTKPAAMLVDRDFISEPTPVIEARARNTNAPKPGLRAGNADDAKANVRAGKANAAVASDSASDAAKGGKTNGSKTKPSATLVGRDFISELTPVIKAWARRAIRDNVANGVRANDASATNTEKGATEGVNTA